MKDPNCIFCKIVAEEIPSEKVYEDDLLIAFRDIQPVAPTHILIVPRKHVQDNNAFEAADEVFAGRMFSVIRAIAEQEGIAENGYRLVMNTGKNGGQLVPHMHMHLMGGHPMKHKLG